MMICTHEVSLDLVDGNYSVNDFNFLWSKALSASLEPVSKEKLDRGWTKSESD